MKNIALFKAVNDEKIEGAVIKVMQSGMIAGGENISKFEKGLSDLLGSPYVVAVSDLTSAISLIFQMLGVKKGDDVLTTSFSCMASNAPIAAVGANAVWVDVSEDSVSIDVDAFERAITPNTKVALVYHVSGYPSPVREIASICKERGIVLIEDCNNALMATVNEKSVGKYGDFGVFSFYPTRLLQTFEGGAITCRLKGDAVRLKKLRRLGIDFATFRNSDGEINLDSDIPEVGGAFSLSNLSAAVGCAQFSDLGNKINRIRSVAKTLKKEFDCIDEIKVLESTDNTNPSYWTFLVLVEQRDEILRFMKGKGVHVSALHKMNHTYTCFKQKKNVYLPNTEYIQEHILGIPCGWWLSEKDVEYIVSMMRLAIKHSHK